MNLIRSASLGRSFRFIVAFLIFSSVPAWAGKLGDYKKQKHTSRPKVTAESCPDEYKKDCKSKCGGDSACISRCDSNAGNFCNERSSRRFNKQVELGAKAGSLAAGAAAMVFDDDMGVADPNGTVPISEYAIYWNRPSLSVNAVGGMLSDTTKLMSGSVAFRYAALGVSANIDHLSDKTDWLREVDVGPTFYLGSAHMLVGFQPSYMVSSGNGVKPVSGFGLRSLNTLFLGESYLSFDPLLGHINNQWNYDVKLAFGHRFTPALSLAVGYSYRDVLDLNDLNISQATLQGLFIRMGFRMN